MLVPDSSTAISAPTPTPIRVAQRKPGASTSKIRSPACAALLLDATTPRVSQLGAARARAMIATTTLAFQLRNFLRIWKNSTSGTNVNAKP